jgi:adenylate kinase family enzyme
MTGGLPQDLLIKLQRANRIHIIGGSGAGKSTLARQIGTSRSLPVHHLDELVLADDGHNLRPEAERQAVLTGILATPTWVTEGIYLKGLGPLLESAEAIIWLDHVSTAAATRRVLRRFLNGAIAEARERHGLARFTRVRDYSRQARALMRSALEMRHYRAADSNGTSDDSPPSRPQTEASLRSYVEKTVHCRTPADVAQLVATLR